MARGRTVGPLLVGLIVATAACDGACGRKPGAPADPKARGAATGFSDRSQKLGEVPAGHEMGDGLFSADGRHVAFVATKDGQAFVFHDGKGSRPHAAVRGLSFLRGGSGLAFIATKDETEAIVVDGDEGPRATEIGTVLPAPDGGVVYSARRAGRWLVVAGKREITVPGEADPSPRLRADGKLLAYVERHPDTGKSNLRVCAPDLTGCVPGETYDGLEAPPSPDPDRSPRLAFIAARNGQKAVVAVEAGAPAPVERASGWFDAVVQFAYSEDGVHAAFLAARGGKQLLIRSGAELPIPALESPLDLLVSSRGQVLMTAVVEGKVVALLDGKPTGKPREGMHFPVFSRDGTSHAFVGETDGVSALVVNGSEAQPYDKVVTPRFTPDGTRMVYRARKDGLRFVVVADAQGKTLREHPRYEAVFDVRFSPDGKAVGYGVRTGRELWWKVEPL